ncbi:hypothetical protein AVT62_gp69 [Streptomyces phage TP1604]|uniref:Uncharacterized protein n=2 Tax=Woodruffvirus TP1604 TaxID=1982746 RepID=A0A1P8VW26_9CAUD|nr:hypothetical protein AVT62_gp69 [Streptomyces phage TP1604]AKA61807.1 hypothetical protein SEA_TP1604_69 [Streptomyces phage TP1604]APZ82238.1 hypothetical protein SEA_BABYGOTBAC_70 [Streptomyces phage BabyGotBac]
MNEPKKTMALGKGQIAVLVLACAPMAAVGAAGAVATFVNMDRILKSGASAAGMVAAGEGATLICALVALAVTLMGQHTPPVVRLGMWLLPLVAAVAGVALASGTNEKIMMAVTPMAMTAAGEGVSFVARRVVAHRTGTDIEQQRRSGLLLWHANRAKNGGAIGRRISQAAVWRLTKAFAETDAQLSVQLGEIQRYRIADGADVNLAAVLAGPVAKSPQRSRKAVDAPAAPLPALPPAAPSEARPQPSADADDDSHAAPAAETERDADNLAWIQGIMAEAQANVKADPQVKLMTVAEVATLKGVAPGTVRSWKHRGKLRVHDVVDGSPMFHPEDVAGLD